MIFDYEISQEVSDRITTKLMDAFNQVTMEESAAGNDGPTLVASIGLILSVQYITQVASIEEVVSVLQQLSLKVERGDYHSQRGEK
jgi:hypothetical protein